MNINEAPGDPDEPPPWFANEEDGADQERPGMRRWLIGLGVLVVVLVMLLIPVLQAELLQRRRASLPDEETERTALQFAAAMLFERSGGQAMLFADNAAAGDVERTLHVIAARPEPSRLARLQVIAAPCNRAEADYCYQGRILDPGEIRSTAIRYGLDETDDGPRVVWVEIDEVRVHRQPSSQQRNRTIVGSPHAARVVLFETLEAGVFGHLLTRASMAQCSAGVATRNSGSEMCWWANSQRS